MNKKNVCIVTYSHSQNYGAALQLFATYKAVEYLGFEPLVLDYVNKFEDSNKLIDVLKRIDGIKGKVRALISSYLLGSIRNGKRNFEPFYNIMNYTKKINCAEQLGEIKNIDVFMVGSDQVWNPQITGEYDSVFLLSNNSIKAKKISFSSSMGSLVKEGNNKKELVESLKKFKKMSVREEVAQQYLIKELNRNVDITVDPTMLFDKDHWNDFIKKNIKKNIKEKYVLIYALGGQFNELLVFAKKIANKIGAKIVTITVSNAYKNVDCKITDATPLDFVNLIFNADFVVTNSFHGTCFSIIGEVPFYSVYFGENPKRVENLLGKYNLSSRLIKSVDKISSGCINNEDIVMANKQIKNEREKSLGWLKEAIND